MNIPATRRYEMLVGVRDFGAAHSDTFRAGSLGGKMFAAMDSAVAALGQHAATQVSSRGAAREGLSTKAAARAALGNALDAIRRTARALALDTPGLDGKFRLPSGHGARALLAGGRAFAQDAQPLATAFVAHGLPPTFLLDLDAAIHGFEAAIHDHAAAIDTFVHAQAGLDAAMEAGLTAVRRLDAIVVNRLRDDSATLAVWERARHVERPPRARNGAPPSVPPGPPAPPAPPAPPPAGAPATT